MLGFKKLVGGIERDSLVSKFGPDSKTLLILPDNVPDSVKSYSQLHTGLRGGVAGPMRPNIVQKPDGSMGYDLHCVGVPSMQANGAVPDKREIEASFERIYELLGTGAYTQVAVPYRNRSVHGGPGATGTEPSFRGGVAAYDAKAQKMFDEHFKYLEEFMNDTTLTLDKRLAKLPQKYQDAYRKGMQSPDKDPINSELNQPAVQQAFRKQLGLPVSPVIPRPPPPTPRSTAKPKVTPTSFASGPTPLPIASVTPGPSAPNLTDILSVTPHVTPALHALSHAPKSQMPVVSDPHTSINNIKEILNNPEIRQELGIKHVTRTTEGLHLKMEDPPTNVHLNEKKGEGINYSADHPIKPETIQQICDIALASAQPGTEFNLSGADPETAKVVSEYLWAKIEEKYAGKPDGEKPKIVGAPEPQTPAVEPAKQTPGQKK